VLTDRAGQDRRVDAHEAAPVEEVVDCLLHLVAHAHVGALMLGAEPQVAHVQQEVDAVLLRLDRVVLARADQLDGLHAELVPSGRARLRANLARHRDARLLSERAEPIPYVGRDLLLHQHALDDAGSVAEVHETDLAVHARALDPPLHGYFFARVLSEAPDLHDLAHVTRSLGCPLAGKRGTSPRRGWGVNQIAPWFAQPTSKSRSRSA
jgi:hypothetical protein